MKSFASNHFPEFWHCVKYSRSESLGNPPLHKDNNIYISAKDKAEMLSHHFQCVFTQDNGSLPDLGPPLCPGMDNIIFTEPGIRKQLDSLSTCKTAGPDGFPARILHDLSAEIAETLCFLFQQSYDSGQLPNDWLVAMIVSVYKKDQRSNPANYRPISLTNQIFIFFLEYFGNFNIPKSSKGKYSYSSIYSNQIFLC